MITAMDDTRFTLSSIRDMAQEARSMAVRARNKNQHPSLQKHTPTHDEAVESLKNIRQLLGTYLELATRDSKTERGLQMELGYCLGALGSLMRDAGKFTEAISYYAAGRACEVRVKTLGGTSNSYCLVQELVARLLLAPEALHEKGPVNDGLHAAAREVMVQIQDDRMRDPWAYADLALLTQLIYPEQAILFWGRLDEFRPLKLIYDSIYHVLQLLYRALEQQLNLQERMEWQKTIARFEEAAMYAFANE